MPRKDRDAGGALAAGAASSDEEELTALDTGGLDLPEEAPEVENEQEDIDPLTAADEKADVGEKSHSGAAAAEAAAGTQDPLSTDTAASFLGTAYSNITDPDAPGMPDHPLGGIDTQLYPRWPAGHARFPPQLPFLEALATCETLDCVRDAHLQPRGGARFNFPHFLVIGWQKSATTSVFQ